MSDERPILGEGADQARAIAAAEEFATGLQAGMDEADADVCDQQFAGDVLWGSPYGLLLCRETITTASRGRGSRLA